MPEGLANGWEEGRQKGRQEGLAEGQLATVRRLLDARFGKLSASALKRLQAKSDSELADISIRLLTAKTLRELL